VSFYAQDSEQAGLLARQQEIENLEKQLRAQALIAEEARSALVRAEAAYTDASQRLVSARREARRDAGPRARAAGRNAAPDAAGRADPRPQRPDRGDLAEVDALLEELQERRVTAEAASRNWTCSWPTARSAMPNWTSA
jgi:chromosome segregation protein